MMNDEHISMVHCRLDFIKESFPETEDLVDDLVQDLLTWQKEESDPRSDA